MATAVAATATVPPAMLLRSSSHICPPPSFPFSGRRPFPALRTGPLRGVASAEASEVDTDIAPRRSGELESDSDAENNPTGTRSFELYVCNLPRSCGIPELSELFKPYGAVISVKVSRDPSTGMSRGCGHVIMSSTAEARAAITALDGYDIGGREMRVKFSEEMILGRSNYPAQLIPRKELFFESPYRIYVGNVAWFLKPADLREHFSQFGTVISTRIVQERKEGKSRVYAFVSFSREDEAQDAVKLHQTVFHGRNLLVRRVVDA